MVTTVAVGNILPNMDSKISDKILVVATISQIIIFYFIKREGRIEVIDSGIFVPTDENIISKIT